MKEKVNESYIATRKTKCQNYSISRKDNFRKENLKGGAELKTESVNTNRQLFIYLTLAGVNNPNPVEFSLISYNPTQLI